MRTRSASPIGLFADLDSAISLAFLSRYPSPVDARLVGEKRLRAFLASQRHRQPLVGALFSVRYAGPELT